MGRLGASLLPAHLCFLLVACGGGQGHPVQDTTSAPAAQPAAGAPGDAHAEQAAHPDQPGHGDHGAGHPGSDGHGDHGAGHPGAPGHGDHGSGHPGAHPGEGHAAGDHDFSDVERWERLFDDPERDEWQRPDEVVRLLDLRPGMTVVDLGAGTGYFLPHLAPAVGEQGRVLALDVEPAMVEHMRERAREHHIEHVDARVVQPDDPGLAPGSVDRVLIVDTWHHISDRVEYAGKLLRALRPGGFVMIVDFTADSPHGPPPRMRLSADTVAGELGSAGLETEIVDEDLPYQYVVRATKPAEP